MLVLSRQQGERIRITTPVGETIWVTITDISDNGKRVRLGIEAPREFVIVREEILHINEGKAP